MEKRVYTPLEYIEGEITKPVIFLAGPIQGAPDWQSGAIRIIKKANRTAIIASPRRENTQGDFDPNAYRAQVMWETFHLKRTGDNGIILFWCPRESHHIDGRSYAQTTRVEFGEWVNEHKHSGTKMVVGIEQGFSGSKYFRIKLEPYPEIPILDNLEQTCLAAVGMVRKK